MSTQQNTEFTVAVDECVEACQRVQRDCLRMTDHSLKLGGSYAGAEHIHALLDCSDLCRLTSDFLLRGSQSGGFAAGLCSHVCKTCAEICERFDDELMENCAQSCHHCAQVCLRISKSEAALQHSLHELDKG